MTTDKAIALIPAAADVDVVRPRLSDDAREFARHALSPATLQAYAIKWRLWTEWAEANRVSVMPAEMVAVSNYLAHVAKHGTPGGKRAKKGREGQSLSSLRQAVAAMAHYHRAAGHGFDTNHPAIAYLLRGIARSRPEAAIQAEALDPALLNKMLAWLAGRKDPWSIRDAALIAVGYAFGRRRSELVGIDLDEMGPGADGFLARHHDRIEITLVRHKTAGAGDEPAVFPVPRKGNRELIAALDRWLKFAKIAPKTPIFRRIHNKAGTVLASRIRGETVSDLLKRRVRQYLIEAEGVDPETATARADAFSAHSMRVGLATASANAGADTKRIMDALGHKSPGMSIRYSAKAERLRGSVHHLEGVSLDGVKTDIPDAEAA